MAEILTEEGTPVQASDRSPQCLTRPCLIRRLIKIIYVATASWIFFLIDAANFPLNEFLSINLLHSKFHIPLVTKNELQLFL